MGIDTGFIGKEPGLVIANTAVKVKGNKKFPVLVHNMTNKAFTLNQGNVIGHLEEVASVANIQNVSAR